MQTAGSEPLNITNGKQTRFSDTAAVAAPAGATVIEPADQNAANVGSRPSTPVSTPNKLTKPGAGGGATSGPSAGSSSAAVPAPGAPAVPTLPAPHQLEEFIMPDGTTVYIKKSERPKMEESIKTKKTEKIATPGGAPPGVPLNESAMGHGHCSVCCPSAPKTAAGQPVQSCAHQDGPVAAVAGTPAAGSAGKPPATKLTKPSTQPPAAVVIPPGPDINVTDVSNIDTDPAALSKGKKPAKTALAPEEQKMEDARSLASESGFEAKLMYSQAEGSRRASCSGKGSA